MIEEMNGVCVCVCVRACACACVCVCVCIQVHMHAQGYKFTLAVWKDSEKVKVLVVQCSTLCDPMDCNPPGSSVQEIFQARFLEWVAISSSRGSSLSRD